MHRRPHRRAARPQNQATIIRITGRVFLNKATHWVVNDTDYEAAAWTCCDVFAVRELLARYFKAVAARTRVVEHPFPFVPSHVLNFDLVVVGTHGY